MVLAELTPPGGFRWLFSSPTPRGCLVWVRVTGRTTKGAGREGPASPRRAGLGSGTWQPTRLCFEMAKKKKKRVGGTRLHSRTRNEGWVWGQRAREAPTSGLAPGTTRGRTPAEQFKGQDAASGRPLTHRTGNKGAKGYFRATKYANTGEARGPMGGDQRRLRRRRPPAIGSLPRPIGGRLRRGRRLSRRRVRVLGPAGRRVRGGAPPSAAFPRHRQPPRPPRPGGAGAAFAPSPWGPSILERAPARRPHAWVRPGGRGSGAPLCVSTGSPCLRGSAERKPTIPSSQLPGTMFISCRQK